MSCKSQWPQNTNKHDREPTKNLSLAETHSEPMNLKVKSPGEASHMGRASAPKSGTYVPSDEQFFHLNTVKVWIEIIYQWVAGEEMESIGCRLPLP